MRLCVCFHQLDPFWITCREIEVIDGLGIDREEAASCTIFRRHVGDGCAIGKTKFGNTRAIEFNKLADNTLGAQHLRYRQHEVCCRCTFLQLAGQLEADDFRDQHGDWLTEHNGLRLNSADTPAKNR